MIDISKISSLYKIRRLDDSDADAVLELCLGNPQFYDYCEEEPTKEQVLFDLKETPAGKAAEDKYFIGFYQNEALVAVMDLIDGYPNSSTAYIGFFMMNKSLQGQGLGSEIITEIAERLKALGFSVIRLAINKGNPQSAHFWEKNGFKTIKEVERNGYILLVAERYL